MIKINLLPTKVIKPKAALVEQGVIALLSVGVVLVILGVLTVNVKGKIEELDKKIITTKSELDKLKKNETKIEALKASEAILQKKIDVIKKLEQRKIGPVKALDEIASKIPGKMWLNNLRIQRALLTLDGVAIDNETIALFMTNLESSDQFNNVELKVAQETKIEEFMLKKFSIACTVRVMEEVKEETTEATPKKKKKKKAKKKKK